MIYNTYNTIIKNQCNSYIFHLHYTFFLAYVVIVFIKNNLNFSIEDAVFQPYAFRINNVFLSTKVIGTNYDAAIDSQKSFHLYKLYTIGLRLKQFFQVQV